MTAKSKIDDAVTTTAQIQALSLGTPWSDANACLAPYVAPQHEDNGTANADGLYNAKTVTPAAGYPINAVAKVAAAVAEDPATDVTTKYGDLHFQTSWRMDSAGSDANLVYGIWMRLVTDQTNWATVSAPWLTVWLETTGTLAADATEKAAVTGINLSCAKDSCIDNVACKFSCMDVNGTVNNSIKEMRDTKIADPTKNYFAIPNSWSTLNSGDANTASRILYNFSAPDSDNIMKYTSGA